MVMIPVEGLLGKTKIGRVKGVEATRMVKEECERGFCAKAGNAFQ